MTVVDSERVNKCDKGALGTAETAGRGAEGRGAQMTRSFQQWRELANCNILWRVTDDQEERAVLLDRVASKCCELERKGETASIWHALSLVIGKPCHCAHCDKEKMQ